MILIGNFLFLNVTNFNSWLVAIIVVIVYINMFNFFPQVMVCPPWCNYHIKDSRFIFSCFGISFMKAQY
jgi:hypothetical protein